MKKDKTDCIERKKKDKSIWIDTILIKKKKKITRREANSHDRINMTKIRVRT